MSPDTDPETDRPAGGGKSGSGGRGSATAALAFGARSLQQVSTLVMTVLAASFLVPAEYGVYTLAVVFVTFIQTLTYTGIFHYLITQKGEESEVLDTTFWLMIGMSAVASVLLALAAPWIARAYDAPDLRAVLWWLAAVQPVGAYAAWCSGLLMRRNRMRAHFGIMLVQNAVALVGGTVLLVLWKSLFALVAFRYLRLAVGAVCYVLVLRESPGLRWRRATASHALGYASNLYGSRMLSFFANYGADLLLGLMFTTAEAGLYRFGNRLATAAMAIVAQPLRSFALTQFGMANRSDARFEPVMARFFAAMALLLGCTAAAVIAFGEPVVEALFDPSYAAALGVAYAMALRSVFSIGTAFVEPVFAAKDRTRVAMLYQLFWTCAQVAAVFALAPFGLTVLAWGQSLTTLAASVGAVVLLARVGGIEMRPALVAAWWGGLVALAYGGLVALTTDRVIEIEGGLSGVVVALAIAGILGVVALFLAHRKNVLDLRVFSG